MRKRTFLYLRRKKFKLLSLDKPVKLSRKKINCPICGEQLVVSVNEWYYDKWGAVALGIEVECASAPAIYSDEFDEWLNHHYSDPYGDWLPLEQRILASLQKFVRFI